MPVTLEVNDELKEVITTAEGPITKADIQSHLSAEGSRHALAYPELIDATPATAAFSPIDARRTVQILRALGEKGDLGPTCVVVSNDVTYGMVRMLEILLDDVCALRPFRVNERAEAEKWLANASNLGKRVGAR